MNKVEHFAHAMTGGSQAPEAAPTLGEIGLDRFAPYLLNRITQSWNVGLTAGLKEHGLNTVQMRTLAVLSIMSGATVNELSVYTVTEQSTMSRSLDGMERDGLIDRLPRRDDMRVREVHVTEKGREAFRRFWPAMHAAFEQMFFGISEAEYAVLIRLLTRVLQNIRKNEI